MKPQATLTRNIKENSPLTPDTTAQPEEEEPPLAARMTKRRLFADVPPGLWNDWRWQFRNRVTSVENLSRYIHLEPQERARLRLVSLKYPLAITPYYMSLMDPDDPADPIRRQALPSPEELATTSASMEDPLAEGELSVVPGLVHRYPDRVLMVLTDICPMLCRHCTRKREWRKGGWVRKPDEIEAMLGYIRAHKEVRDVIVSGGDPLTLSTRRLEEVLSGIRSIEHVEIIRIGTRVPVVMPQRIDDELCNMLSKYGPIWLNTHFNHPHELTSDAARACDRLVRAGVPVNNQSVLLRGVNDSLQTQLKLCQGLLKIKVRPYYLFQCDDAAGTEHFWTSVETGIEIIRGMRGFTSGLAIPNYVIDLPNGKGKITLQPDYVLERNADELVVRNYLGEVLRYPNPGGIRRRTVHSELVCDQPILA